MQNAKTYLIIIAISILIWVGITYWLNNKTIEQQLEEQNATILQDCLSKARVKEVPSEIMESASHCNKSLLKTIYSPAYSGTGSEINCPELNQSWKVIESPRQWVTFYFTKEEVKELYPDCKIWTASTTPVSSVPIWKIIPKASASEKKPLQYTVTAKSVGKSLKKVSTQIEFKSGSIIYRNGWNDPRVQYAYNISGGDMDFIKTIEAESKWGINALWDNGKSFWLCQIHKWYNPEMQKAYRALKTDNEKVKMCYDQYKDWVNRWVIKTRLYWFNVRNKPQNKNSFTIK